MGCTQFVEDTPFEKLVQNMGGPSQEVISIGRLVHGVVGQFRALDVGSGTGRNSIYLAGLGGRVTAVDSSASLIDALTSFSRRGGLNVDAVCARVEQFSLPDHYDLVLCHGILHHLSLPTALDLVALLKSRTTPSGVHMITLLDSGVGNTDQWLKMYQDWSCLALERYIKRDYHPGIGYDLHWVEKLIFQHPGSAEHTLSSQAHRFTRDAKPDVHEFFMTDELMRTRKAVVVEKLGAPDLSFVYETDGTQLSFHGVASGHHRLALLFWANNAAYFENDILVGYSQYQSDCFHTFYLDADKRRT